MSGEGKVIIGDYTLIGANTTILPGITIGKHVKIGAGTVVSKDVPITVLHLVTLCKYN